MDNLDEIFASMDESIFTSDLKESLQLKFNAAVLERADEIVAERVDMLESEAEEATEAKIVYLEEKAEEATEAKIAYLEEKAEEYAELSREELTEHVAAYVDRVVAEFVNEVNESLDTSVTNERADMMLEAFDAMILAGGVSVADIADLRESNAAEDNVTQNEKYDAVVDENIELARCNAELIKMGIIAEMKEGMSIVEGARFTKLAALVPFSKNREYADKLATVREEVSGVSHVDEANESTAATEIADANTRRDDVLHETRTTGLIATHLI